MPIIDFYIFEEASGDPALLALCRLIEKAYQQQQTIYVHTPSQEAAEMLDDLLWSFRDDSFIPHALYEADDQDPPPVQIGFGAAPKGRHQVLVNLAEQAPDFYMNYANMIEIVFSDPTVQQLARVRYKQYRDQGHTINTHKLKAADV